MIDAPQLSASQKAMLAAQRGVRLAEAADNGTSSTYLNYARTVMDRAPYLVDAIVSGDMTLDHAYPIARNTPRPLKPKPPKKVNRQTDARLQREQRIRLMAEEGHSEDAIAAQLGVRRYYVNQVLHRLGMQTLRERLGTNRRLDADRVMDKLMEQAQPPLTAIEAIDWDQLDPSRLQEWERQLNGAIQEWAALRRRLRNTRHGYERGQEPETASLAS